MDNFEAVKLMDREEMAEMIAEIQRDVITQIEDNYHLNIGPEENFNNHQKAVALNWLNKEI